jgi:hypothetical protein
MRKSLPRNRLVGPLILGSLLIFAALVSAIVASKSAPTSNPPPYPTYNVHSSEPQGTRALSLWLSRLGYQTRTLEYQPFHVSENDQLLFMLFPSLDPTDSQIDEIVNWVRQGGTLVVASGIRNSLMDQLGAGVIQLDTQTIEVHPVQPTLSNPPVGASNVDVYASLYFRDPAWVPLLAGPTNDVVVAGVRSEGDGEIIALTTGDPFSNGGLTQPGNTALVMNLLAMVPPGSGAVIDEYHHGFTEQGTFTRQLVHQPWGQAILLTSLLIFLFILATGRRLGPAVRPYVHALKRTRSEFAVTLASMLHQNGHREWLRDRYLEQQKRILGVKFRVPSNQPTPSFIEQIARRNPVAAELADPFRELESEQVPDEGRLVALIREIEQITARLVDRPGTGQATNDRAAQARSSRHVLGKTET